MCYKIVHLIFYGFCILHISDGQLVCDLFDLTAANISSSCLKQLNVTCRHPELNWKFFDASSKFLTSGMSYSNVIDYGNFPECISIKHQEPDEVIIGKYCGLSTLIVNIFLQDPKTQQILHSYDIDPNDSAPQVISALKFRSLEASLRDSVIPGVPNNWIISKYSSCVPNACTPREVGYYYWYGHVMEAVSLIIYTDLECETVNSNTTYEAGDIVVIIFLVAVALLLISSTIYDALCQNFRQKPYHPLCLAFSVLYNGKKLLHVSTDTTEQIHVFNGMRFISMMWVMAFHAAAPFDAGAVSLENFPQVKQWNEKVSVQYIQAGLLAVDTFFYITGFLLAFSYIKSSAKKTAKEQITAVPKMYLHRYLRLTPALGVMYLITITIYRFLGSGPTWSLITRFMSDACRRKWWDFFLYIQNYTDPNDMCINPMWYLSADMQMFVLAPLVLIPVALYIRTKFKTVIIGLTSTTIVSIIISMLVRYFYANGSKDNLQATHDRFCNVLMGITFGATLRVYQKKPYIFSRIMNLVLWILVLIISLAFILYWFDVRYNYTNLKNTLFMGLYRPIWCLCLTFMTYSCYHNYGGIVQWFLSIPSFQILGRLSYSMYVLHILVELYALATLKTSQYFSNYMLFYNFCGHLIVTMLMATVWVLAFEFPMLTIDKYLLGEGVSKFFVRLFTNIWSKVKTK